jgi:hypothetical protein
MPLTEESTLNACQCRAESFTISDSPARRQ